MTPRRWLDEDGKPMATCPCPQYGAPIPVGRTFRNARRVETLLGVAGLALYPATALAATSLATSDTPAALPPLLAWPLRVLGALLMMYGLFAVPNDVKRYESYLVIWWTWVEQKREAGLRWQAAFLQVVTTVMTRAFDRLFGATLLSRRAIVGSITLSLASMYLASGIGILILAWMGDRKAYDLFLAGASLVLGAVPLWLVLRGAVRAMVIFDTVLLSLLVVLVVAFFAIGRVGWDTVRVLPAFVIGLVAALILDVLFVAATRHLLRISQSMTSALRIAALIVLNVLSAVALVGGPAAVAMTLPLQERTLSLGALAAWFIALSKMIDGLIALSVVLLGAVMLAHRVIWPLIGRPLEVVSSERVLSKRWPLFFAGLSLLGVSWTPFGALLRLLQGT
jgi:hypothetical protein